MSAPIYAGERWAVAQLLSVTGAATLAEAMAQVEAWRESHIELALRATCWPRPSADPSTESKRP